MKGEVRTAALLFIVLSGFCIVDLCRGLQGSVVVASSGSIRPRSIDRPTYFECSFSKTSSEFQLNQYWNPDSSSYPCQIGVWQWRSVRNPETGEYSGNNPYGGSMRLVPDPTDPSNRVWRWLWQLPGPARYQVPSTRNSTTFKTPNIGRILENLIIGLSPTSQPKKLIGE